MLRRDGWAIGKKLVYRLCCEEGLVLRSQRPKRRKMVVHREACCQPKCVNEAWNLDFIHNQLSNGQKFRALTVVDIFSREVLAIEVSVRLRGELVVEVLNRLVRQRGAPKYLFAGNARNSPVSLLTSGLTIMASGLTSAGPASLRTNAFIETFNGSLRDECLNLHWFEMICEARSLIEAWRLDYNESRPHMALGNKTPLEYALFAVYSPQAKGVTAGES